MKTLTIAANMKKAARDAETVSIGGGEFTPAELRQAASQLEAVPELVAALYLITEDKDGDGFICREAMDVIRNAIAKAEGMQ